MTGFAYDEALSASLEYFNGEELPARVFVDKYALRNKDNELLEKTPDDMHRRLASEFARIESTKFKDPLSFDTIYSYFKNYSKIIPQGSPIFGIGNKEQNVSLSNCFVVPSPADSYGGIMQTDQHIVQISKRRGGIGYDISELRPADVMVSNAAKTTSGAVSFMHRFSATCREVCQDGRRGAMMISMSVHHPQVEDFATIKNDDKSVTGANISLRLTDEFLDALLEDKDYEQRWPIDSKKPKFKRMVSAKKVWKTIVHSAWSRAEPGILFWDNILRESPADCYAEFGFKTVSTNPCGEIPLSAYDSCRLMAINLLHCVKNAFTKNAYFDFKLLYETAQITQRLMDDLVDLELEAIDKLIAKVKADPELDSIKRVELELWENVKKSCINGRRTGTGITGLGDVLAALGIKYGSDQSIHTTNQIYQTLKFGSYRSSVDMAKELGPFPIWNWELEKKNPFIKRIKDEIISFIDMRQTGADGSYREFKSPPNLTESFEDCVVYGKELYEDIKKYGRRNIANLTSAPTGTISTQASIEVLEKLFFNISSGIEPVWSYEYTRRKKVCPGDEGVRVDFVDDTGDSWMEFPVYHSGVSAWMYANGINDNLADIELEVMDKNPYKGSTANDINWVQRVKLQAAAQKHVDHSISSTVNLPSDVKEEEVAKIYEAAWKAGCKGITVYRDGCRSGVLVDKSKEQAIISTERPKDLPCDVHHITVKGKQYFVLVGLMNGIPYEVFSGKNGFIDKDIKTGVISRRRKGLYKVTFEDDSELSPITASCDENEETITRLTSALLRSGADMHLVVQQLEKVNGEMSGFAKSLSRGLKKYIPDGTKVVGEECPECKSIDIIRQEGCKTCRCCGWSKCS